MASNSTGFPRAGSIQIPIVFSLPAATLAQNTTYFLHGTTTTASNKPLGFPYRVVGLYGTFPAQTNNTTGTR
ncbi:MAG: hypothetical protein FJ109_20280, partial [Deltaproteobacteria bacterium]|nr:hypothetical protein [Deltaproteobacteria bacterium]